MPLPNLWGLYNLRSSPYFQACLQTQAELVTLWGIKQPSVSQTLQQLIAAGAAEMLPRRGCDPIQYLLTGTWGWRLAERVVLDRKPILGSYWRISLAGRYT